MGPISYLILVPPALTETKEPAGGVVSPAASLPQQATEPSFLTPQVSPVPALTETKEPAGGLGGGVGVGVGCGVEMGYGVFVGLGDAVGIGVGVGVEVVKVAATVASTVASIAVPASRVPRVLASTVAGKSGVGGDTVCVSAGDGASLVQATAARPKIAKTIRMTIHIFFLQYCENFQSSLSTGSAATGAEPANLPGRMPGLARKPPFPRSHPVP